MILDDVQHDLDEIGLRYAASSDADVPDLGWEFGASLVSGDFNGDGVADLAVGAPGIPVTGCWTNIFDPTCKQAGGVAVYFGARGARFTLTGSRLLTLHTLGRGDLVQGQGHFGQALAAADIDRDGRGDLIISAPGNSSVFNEAPGAVFIVAGSNLRSVRSALAGAGGNFGSALVTGDFDGDGDRDVAVAAPEKDVGDVRLAGEVWIYKNRSGVIDDFSLFQRLNQSIVGTPEKGDFFGTALATGDFNADGRDDLAIGVPGEDVPVGGVERVDAGEVDVIYGSAFGLSVREFAPQRFHQSSAGIPGSAEASDFFGLGLTAGNFGKDAARDLAIGVPLEDIGAIVDAGAVNVIFGVGIGNRGLSAEGSQILHQDVPGVPGGAENGDRFGMGL